MTRLELVAPRIGRAHREELAHRMRAVSRCAYGGWHAHMAGPCFDSAEAAMRRRDLEERQWAQGRAA